jgi:hypothetical protein
MHSHDMTTTAKPITKQQVIAAIKARGIKPDDLTLHDVLDVWWALRDQDSAPLASAGSKRFREPTEAWQESVSELYASQK